MLANQTEYSRLEHRSVIRFLVAEKCKLCEIYRIMCDVYKETCFSYKENYKLVKHRFATTRPSRKQPIRWKRTDFRVKKKFRVQQSIKKIMLVVFWGRKRTHQYWFPWKTSNYNKLLPISNSLGKIRLMYWMTLAYIERDLYFFNLFILFLFCYIYVCFQLVAFVREHMWHKAFLMGYSMRLELTLVSS